jgi:hypothetical protein
MQNEWWESPVCWLCDYWWALLAAVLLALTAYFTSDLWLPKLGFEPGGGLQDVRVSQRDVELTLRDNGNAVDGDRTRVSLNGEIVLEDHTLTGEGTVVTLDLKRGSNLVEIMALNEGYSSPNTVEVAVSHIVEGPAVQVSDDLITGEMAEFTIRAPWW